MNIQDKTDVIKASPAIHIQGNITHLQRRLWNVLLANAYDELLTKDVHEISVTALIDKLEYDSHNREYLLEFFESLVDCKLKWNLLNKDEEWEYGIAVLLSSVVIRESGVCTYDFPSQLRPKLHNPRMYAKINLRLQNKFKSKYALILWEICLDYFDESRGEGESPFIPLETFKELGRVDE